MKKNIMITGGCGFLGQNIIRRLIQTGDYTLTCLDRYAAPFLAECGVHFISGDISDEAQLTKCLQGIDIIVHLACTMLPQSSNCNPFFDLASNAGGSLHLLNAAVKNNVEKFIFLSSGGTVYGIPQQIPIPESHPTNPTCSYGISKLMIEKYLRLYHTQYGLKCCAIRLANPFGPYQNVKSTQGAIAVFCYKALSGEPIEIWGDGSVRRDFIYVDDAVSAIQKVLETENELPPEMNIGSGQSTSILELLEQIETLTGRKLKCRFLEKRSFDVPVSQLDISLAMRTLGWHPETSLSDGLRKTMDFIRKSCLD